MLAGRAIALLIRYVRNMDVHCFSGAPEPTCRCAGCECRSAVAAVPEAALDRLAACDPHAAGIETYVEPAYVEVCGALRAIYRYSSELHDGWHDELVQDIFHSRMERLLRAHDSLQERKR